VCREGGGRGGGGCTLGVKVRRGEGSGRLGWGRGCEGLIGGSWWGCGKGSSRERGLGRRGGGR